MQPAKPVAAADLERLHTIQDQQIAPFLDSDGLMRRFEPCVRALPEADPFDIGKSLSIELVRMGFPRLGDDQLIRFNEVRLAMAATSRPACAQLWTGGLEDQDLEVTLAQLPEAQIADFYRLRAAAGIAGGNADGPPPRDPEGIELAAGELRQRLGEEEWARVQALLDDPEPTVDEACYLLQSVLGTASKMSAAAHARTVRALLAEASAEPSPLPAACLFPK